MYNTLKSEHKFPAVNESDAMFSAEIAPEWADDPKCYRCNLEFTVFSRKVK